MIVYIINILKYTERYIFRFTTLLIIFNVLLSPFTLIIVLE